MQRPNSENLKLNSKWRVDLIPKKTVTFRSKLDRLDNESRRSSKANGKHGRIASLTASEAGWVSKMAASDFRAEFRRETTAASNIWRNELAPAISICPPASFARDKREEPLRIQNRDDWTFFFLSSPEIFHIRNWKFLKRASF